MLAEATKSNISNGSSEFNFEAYDVSTSHVPNNFIAAESKDIIKATPVYSYQTDYEEETSSASINQPNYNEFGTNSIINPSFVNTINARFPNAQLRNIILAYHHPSPSSNDSSSSSDL
jgi:hypothetical protein